MFGEYSLYVEGPYNPCNHGWFYVVLGKMKEQHILDNNANGSLYITVTIRSKTRFGIKLEQKNCFKIKPESIFE